MGYDRNLFEWAREALAPIGEVGVRPMMGVAILNIGAAVFAVIDDEIWFKADAATDAVWDEAGCARYLFTSKQGETASLNFRRAPGDVYDDAEAMQQWTALALEAADRAAAKRRPKKPRAKTAKSR